eukprot:g4736.t1
MRFTHFFLAIALGVFFSSVGCTALSDDRKTFLVEKGRRDRKWLASMGGSFSMGFIGGMSEERLNNLFFGTNIDQSSVKRMTEEHERLGEQIAAYGYRSDLKGVDRLSKQKSELADKLKVLLQDSLTLPEPQEDGPNCDAELAKQALEHKVALEEEAKQSRDALSTLRATLEGNFQKEAEQMQQALASQHEAALEAQAQDFEKSFKQVQEEFAAQLEAALKEQAQQFQKAFAEAQENCAASQEEALEAQANDFKQQVDTALALAEEKHAEAMEAKLEEQAEEFRKVFKQAEENCAASQEEALEAQANDFKQQVDTALALAEEKHAEASAAALASQLRQFEQVLDEEKSKCLFQKREALEVQARALAEEMLERDDKFCVSSVCNQYRKSNSEKRRLKSRFYK